MKTSELLAGIKSKNNAFAWECTKTLSFLSGETPQVYAYFDIFLKMLADKSSYVRNRAIMLIAANIKWDKGNKFNAEDFLFCITDEKPVTARQCIKALPEIAKYKPKLKKQICTALEAADISKYTENMRPLIENDIKSAKELIFEAE